MNDQTEREPRTSVDITQQPAIQLGLMLLLLLLALLGLWVAWSLVSAS